MGGVKLPKSVAGGPNSLTVAGQAGEQAKNLDSRRHEHSHIAMGATSPIIDDLPIWIKILFNNQKFPFFWINVVDPI